jgi:hypothetical protein
MESNQEKLTPEELGALRSRHDNFNACKDNIAMIAVRISRLKAQEIKSLEMYEEVEANLEGYESELQGIYGDGISSFNLGDGTITRKAD